jgi:glutamate racemase
MIGVFDSGVGGLSVWQELVRILPCEEYIYVSDSGYCPYGPKPKEYVVDRAKRITEFLIDKGADIIVVACNTATAAAIDILRRSYRIPFVGMEPAVKPAALNSASGVIGVLATQGTFKGELYLRTLHKFAANTKVMEQIGTGLVELVESGNTDTLEAEQLLLTYLKPMMDAGADHIVLGCTHYPFLSDTIKKIAGDSMAIVNPAPAIANRTKELLQSVRAAKDDNIQNNGSTTNHFYTTGSNISLIHAMVNEIMAKNGCCNSVNNQFHTINI